MAWRGSAWLGTILHMETCLSVVSVSFHYTLLLLGNVWCFQQAGLVGGPVREFHRLCQLHGETRIIFSECVCSHLGMPNKAHLCFCCQTKHTLLAASVLPIPSNHSFLWLCSNFGSFFAARELPLLCVTNQTAGCWLSS